MRRLCVQSLNKKTNFPTFFKKTLSFFTLNALSALSSKTLALILKNGKKFGKNSKNRIFLAENPTLSPLFTHPILHTHQQRLNVPAKY